MSVVPLTGVAAAEDQSGLDTTSRLGMSLGIG